MGPQYNKEEKNIIPAKRGPYGAIKRLVDFLVSLVFSIALIPVFLIFSLVIFFTDFHSPFFFQTRIGKGGRSFRLIKFRTMKYDAENFDKYFTSEQKNSYDSEYKLESDPRITPIGRFLRRFSIDELPQFLNVITGKMSLIGPRPLTEKETYFFGKDRDLLLSVRPGITGLWQVSGRNALTYASGDRQRCELRYIENFGFGIDLKIFFKTFKEIFSGSGK